MATHRAGVRCRTSSVAREPRRPTRFGLTDRQHHTLVTAFRQGYYSVPRDSDIRELSNTLGVTHQATSQRLRRGHERLIRRALVEQPSPSLPY
ncbi:helix-turn-helix domain-containing protein (plasmid) [Haloferax prahovense]|uniref:helix-turn-helix domain-containing protein n=1 Tax=Haloferax prahovense TaxID=381852 RepID=UPI003C764B6B